MHQTAPQQVRMDPNWFEHVRKPRETRENFETLREFVDKTFFTTQYGSAGVNESAENANDIQRLNVQ